MKIPKFMKLLITEHCEHVCFLINRNQIGRNKNKVGKIIISSLLFVQFYQNCYRPIKLKSNNENMENAEKKTTNNNTNKCKYLKIIMWFSWPVKSNEIYLHFIELINVNKSLIKLINNYFLYDNSFSARKKETIKTPLNWNTNNKGNGLKMESKCLYFSLYMCLCSSLHTTYSLYNKKC